MSSARQGFKWWEVDVTYYVLCGLEKLVIVIELRPALAQVLNGNSGISAKTKDRIRHALAPRFCPDGRVYRLQKRRPKLNSGQPTDDCARTPPTQTSVSHKL